MSIVAGLGARLAGTAAGQFVTAHLFWIKVAVIGILALSIWLWYRGQINAADEAGYNRAKAECSAEQLAKLTAELEALAEKQRKWGEDQKTALESAAADKAARDLALVAIDDRLTAFRRDFNATKATLAPVPCRADSVRVQQTNAALGHGS